MFSTLLYMFFCAIMFYQGFCAYLTDASHEVVAGNQEAPGQERLLYALAPVELVDAAVQNELHHVYPRKPPPKKSGGHVRERGKLE